MPVNLATAATQKIDEDKIGDIAADLADETVKAIATAPDDFAAHKRILHNLKLKCLRDGLELAKGNIKNRERFLNGLALNFPDFNTDALYQKRKSLVSLAAAIFLGWFIGGLVSTLLGFIGLGGEILRPLLVFIFIWFEEYLCANGRARNILLGVLGMAGIGRFAAMVAGGMFRFTNFGAFRQAVLGGARTNIFKSVWLLIGALFVFIFLAKKVSGLDKTAFRDSLQKQIEEFLQEAAYIAQQISRRDGLIESYEKQLTDEEKAQLQKKNRDLAAAVMDILDSLPSDNRAYLMDKLEAAGFKPQAGDDPYLIWDETRDRGLYDTVGSIKDGDRCLILKRPYAAGDKIIRGHAQKAV